MNSRALGTGDIAWAQSALLGGTNFDLKTSEHAWAGEHGGGPSARCGYSLMNDDETLWSQFPISRRKLGRVF